MRMEVDQAGEKQHRSQIDHFLLRFPGGHQGPVANTGDAPIYANLQASVRKICRTARIERSQDPRPQREGRSQETRVGLALVHAPITCVLHQGMLGAVVVG